MSFIVPLIVSAAAIVALGGIVINTLLAVKGIAHFGKTLAQASRHSEESAGEYSRLEERPRPEPRSRNSNRSFDTPADDPTFDDDQALDRLNQYFDHP